MTLVTAPVRQVRATFNELTIRVYQAYPNAIADAALIAQTFVAPFKRGRMTWIKPSFTWMMYRSGWASKPLQVRILAIDILRSGFEWALAHSAESSFLPNLYRDHEEWRSMLDNTPVRIQWDPERTIGLEALPWRTIQVGLQGAAVAAYVDQWITRICDVTPLAIEIGALVAAGNIERAEMLRPEELPYPLPHKLAKNIGASVG